ncbi:Cytochrome oxidase assembly protein [Gemmata obscuriglobus]|uniref:Cytochrome oxidase assembly protein n=1 Tax=Gemmata obscuriglobus TaxID=114 RepID=A0A2Z3H533_9BACT|nr:hypothetical protein [Gemmata obscuriglobus]AWM36130.1 hypothetical protein C1280_03330 [Gemmata obscuriglobus]QEG31280.1 Cytochrome oxidase assembly protein [Gemmata obscuriglobus]VTS10619.1 hypothetical protein : Cytochrome oxidase assembly OS=Planctomyces brasiliensis (strain ATCC 49424 / DSM 5305 / JCM 21570 / NBRC 103401 / IFAM 1448) GN=Plabr_2264 PE=4 SV=1: COX15-CtaA: COX15-CtaA [Gemmata obscuriglobus UQM 2246]
MTDFIRPVPRWLHVWAVLAVLATLVLLAIGQLVTSFGAGMADPVWPTEPWYVFHTATEAEKERFRKDYAFFLEHSHRIAGWTIGGVVIVLTGGLWWTEPRKVARWWALGGAFVLIAGYSEFHRGLRTQHSTPAAEVTIPAGAAAVATIGAANMVAVAVFGLLARTPGASVRLLGSLSLVAVMIQGLLGGFRVKLNELVGADLAAFHGIFAQVVLGLLTAVAVLTSRQTPEIGTSTRRLGRWASVLAVVVFVQVAFGAMVRHYPVPLSQRLHFATAFLATGLAVWVLRAVLVDVAALTRARGVTWVLAALLVVQLYLGIEAWLAKFGAYMLPELVPVTPEGGAIRTLHALVGSGVWAAALALALRLGGRRTSEIVH